MATREPITKQRILRAAVEIADEDGVGKLTMRRIAERLGVEAMSLYHHVPTKSAILDGIVDEVFAEIGPPQADRPWRESVRECALRTREVLRRHRWAVVLMESRAAPGPATLRHHDAVIACLRSGGFTLARTALAFSVIDSYIFGFVLQEVTLPFDSTGEIAAEAEAVLAAFPDGDPYPHLTELAVDHVMKPGYAYADEFTNGLDLILDGLDRLVGS